MTELIPRGSTPYLAFSMPFDTSTCSNLHLDIESVSEHMGFDASDMLMSGEYVLVPLTQEQTMRLKSWVRMQFRAVIDGKVMTSEVIEMRVSELIDEEVLHLD